MQGAGKLERRHRRDEPPAHLGGQVLNVLQPQQARRRVDFELGTERTKHARHRLHGKPMLGDVLVRGQQRIAERDITAWVCSARRRPGKDKRLDAAPPPPHEQFRRRSYQAAV
jgi:hypothetical protein